MKGSEAKGRAYASEMPVQGEKALYKVAIVRQGVREASRSRQDRSRGGAGSRAASHLTCNQTPAYIRGFGPLD
jgi:hypothetical protein